MAVSEEDFSGAQRPGESLNEWLFRKKMPNAAVRMETGYFRSRIEKLRKYVNSKGVNKHLNKEAVDLLNSFEEKTIESMED